jgi:arylsulfatase
VLDAAEVSYPKTFNGRPIDSADGKSLLPILRNEPRDGHATLYWGAISGKAIRQGKWKLVRARNNPWELYDMDADRTELSNLAGQHPEKVQALEKAWETWRDTVNLPKDWRDPKIFSK